MAAAEVGAALQRTFDKADATLALCESRLEREIEQSVGARHNPTRLLKRLAALEAELPKLRAVAEENAAARRAILAPLLAKQAANQLNVVTLARRAAADVADEHAQWTSEHNESLAQLSRCGEAEDDAAAGGGAAAPAPTTALAAAAVSEAEFSALAQTEREGRELAEVNALHRCLLSHFARRETRELQAAQLVAVGISVADARTASTLRVLQRLGRLVVAGNAVSLAG